MRNLVLGFITLTLLDGSHLRIEALRPNVSIIHPEHGTACAKKHATAVRVGGTPYCVLETEEQIEAMVCKDNEDCHK